MRLSFWSTPMSSELQGTINTTANVYFDGKCVSHSITLADGTKKISWRDFAFRTDF
jgi:hypothetical protein